MAYFHFSNIKIAGVASAVPTNKISIDSFVSQYGEDYITKFKKQTGIESFYKTAEHQTASDLCFVAAQEILQKKNINPTEIGALVFVAHSTDYRRPATACVMHKRLGLHKDCVAFDISLGCSAFVYGLQTVCSLMQSSDISKALLLTGETLTKITNPKDTSVSMLFGDGGGAILLEKTQKASNIIGLLRSDGNGYRDIIMPGGGARNPYATHKEFVAEDGSVKTLYNSLMKGENVFAFTISDIPTTIKDFLAHTKTTILDYDSVVLHQANSFILKFLAKQFKITPEQLPISINKYGNTSAAAIPLTLSHCYGGMQENKVMHTLMCGFGVGLSWGVASALINTADIFPVIETDKYFAEGIINSIEEI